MASIFYDLTSAKEISSIDNHIEQVDSYFIQPRYASVIGTIMNKHGDIARDFPIRSNKMPTLALERVCDVI
ncbi:conserved hypothetical protein [Ricinus communis]|uniref:Uncharacterized protein n=1 Tax=Ricinus communis TaxID=3988 RepID=B9SJG2_RICCO|nr:conserved hypothetical protein [Ricinus communis]